MTAPRRFVIRPEWISFGGTSATVTSMGLILGLEAAGASRQSIVAALLIVAIADNLTDSLSVHIYQEAERLPERSAFLSTVANFFTRLAISLTFVAGAAMLPARLIATIAVAWGFVLLAFLTRQIALARGAPVAIEVGKHVVVASVVLVVSRVLGGWIGGAFA
ncbi:MAG TPA: hypothetical protein VLY46_12230 [Usitatibacter sp.]|nr:hypothetical protein [Usitatibacter sp.]